MIWFIHQNVSYTQTGGWVAQWLQRLGLDQMIGGSNPETSKFLFHFYSLISSHLDEFSSFQSKKRAQKLFVQFHYFNVFMYVSIIYDKKQESKVLGYLSRLSFNFWTGWLHFNWMQNSEVSLLGEVTYWIGNSSLGTLIQDVQQNRILHFSKKVNSVKEACAKCFTVHLLKETLQTTWKNKTKQIKMLNQLVKNWRFDVFFFYDI